MDSLIKALQLETILADDARMINRLAGLRQRVAEHMLDNPSGADSAIAVLRLIAETRKGREECGDMGIIALATDAPDMSDLRAKIAQYTETAINMMTAAMSLFDSDSNQELGFPESFAQGLRGINLDPQKPSDD